MTYLVECCNCRGLCWTGGIYEADTNAFTAEPEPSNWEPNDEDKQDADAFTACNHEEFEVVDFEYAGADEW